MKSASVVALLLLAIVAVAAAAPPPPPSNKTFGADGVWLKVSGRSGRCVVGRKQNPDEDANRIIFKFLGLQEVDEDGAIVGAQGKVKHSFKSFASQDFTISDMTAATYQGVDAMKFSFESSLLAGSANFTADVYIMKAAGAITEGDEEMEVTAGSVKMNFEMRDWTFCDPAATAGTLAYCKNSAKAGAFLDLSVQVGSRSKPARKAAKAAKAACKKDANCKKPEKIALGGGVEMDLLSNVNVDGTVVTMPTGFPKMDGTRFTFRLPKFTSSVVYDPVINTASDGNAGSTTAPALYGILLIASMLMMLLL